MIILKIDCNLIYIFGRSTHIVYRLGKLMVFLNFPKIAFVERQLKILITDLKKDWFAKVDQWG